MFYLPIWFENKFDLSWLTAARPIEQGFIAIQMDEPMLEEEEVV